MKRMHFGVLLLAFAAHAQDPAPEKINYLMCKNQKVVRTVRVVLAEDGSCQAIYAKDGKDKVVGSGKFAGTCYQVLANIRRNLSEAGWKCRDISDAAIVE